MSVGKRAARGAIWSVGVSTGTRLLGLIGTLFMTRFLDPDQVGEVYTALAIGQTANWLSNWGFNPYMIVHGAKGDEQTYHVAVINLVLGFVGVFFANLIKAAVSRQREAVLSASCLGWCPMLIPPSRGFRKIAKHSSI